MCSQSEICQKVPPVAQLKRRSVTVVSSPRLPVTLPSSSHTTKILARPESSCHPVQRRSLTPDAVPPLVSLLVVVVLINHSRRLVVPTTNTRSRETAGQRFVVLL